MKKDLAVIQAAARAKGWRVDLTRNGHVRFRSPDGQATVVAPSTPSCHRGLLNLRASLRRAGLETDRNRGGRR